MNAKLVEINEDAAQQAARHLAATLEPSTIKFLFSLLLRPVPPPPNPQQATPPKAA